MEKIETNLQDCYILQPKRFGAERGYFESITKEDLEELDFKGVHQISNSLSGKGTVRGLHFQKAPYAQAKVVRCHRGGVLDVVVDIRKDSPSYRQWTSVELTPENGKLLYVPRGFAHGFVALKDDTLFEYCVDNKYKPNMEGGILWNDPEIGINWEEIFKKYGITEPILSAKDKDRCTLKDCDAEFYVRQNKYLITGYKGQLGYDIKRELMARGVDERNILAIDKDEMDITNREEVMNVVTNYNPDVIFHCAAWTAVDKAEAEKELCHMVNVDGTRNIVDASIATDAKIIYLSTDYVFDGKKDLEETYNVDDEPNPMSIYGLTKYLGEQEVRRNPKHFITRISWVFGINGNNFIKTMLKLSDSKKELSVVDDQIGSPTYTVDLAKLLVVMGETDKYGTYHANNEGFTSWADFAEYIFKVNGKDVKVNHVSTEEYAKLTGQKQAYRPRNSKLSKDSLDAAGFERLPSWQDATVRYSEELTGKKLVLARENK